MDIIEVSIPLFLWTVMAAILGFFVIRKIVSIFKIRK